MEIVEIGAEMPMAGPDAQEFVSRFTTDMINPNPSLPIQFAPPTIQGLVHSTIAKPVYKKAFVAEGEGMCEIGGILADVGRGWSKSVLGYQFARVPGQAFVKGVQEVAVEEVKKGLRGQRWDFGEQTEGEHGAGEGRGSGQGKDVLTIWAWVGKKRL